MTGNLDGSTLNCWPFYPYGYPYYPPVTQTFTIHTHIPDTTKCGTGKHHYIRVVEDALGALTGRSSRLLLFCEQCGDIIEYPPAEESEDE